MYSERPIAGMLSRLRREGWVSTTWAESVEGPPRRYYALTPAGQHALLARRTELLAEIRGHISASLSGTTDADEAAVRTMLDRLGDAADIVAPAVEDDPPEPGTQGRRPGIGLEVGAVVMLTVGSVIPVIGWVVGLILLWSSGVWRRSEKLLGTLIVPGGPGLILLFGLIPSQTCISSSGGPVGGPVTTTGPVCTGFALPPALGIAIMLLVLIAPIVFAIVLISRARARTAPVHRVPSVTGHQSAN